MSIRELTETVFLSGTLLNSGVHRTRCVERWAEEGSIRAFFTRLPKKGYYQFALKTHRKIRYEPTA